MINKNTQMRELAYVCRISEIKPISGKDRVECAIVNGWTVMVRKGQFNPGDLGIYFEIDSKVPAKAPFEFLTAKHYKIKTQKYSLKDENGNKVGQFWSQGLLMSADDFGWELCHGNLSIEDTIDTKEDNNRYLYEGDFLTERLGVVYSVEEDNKRKANNNPDAQINAALARHSKIAKKYGKYIKNNSILRKIFLLCFGRKKDSKTSFPTHMTYIKKTDQERCENMPWILDDKTPFIVTQKCDGSSGTYILERKPFGRFEFYVCSRNVRQLTPDQKSYYDDNYYWECAIKYDIENKLKDYLKKHPDLQYICWQGEICAPNIQKNPHKLTETHLFCFHMIDSKQGKYDMREAIKIWKEYGMETVPIIDENYILPDDFEEFKLSADGEYDPSVCENKKGCKREGFVYYKTTDPSFSFKNVSREYLAKHNG